jgi:signal transduction histidine kinase
MTAIWDLSEIMLVTSTVAGVLLIQAIANKFFYGNLFSNLFGNFSSNPAMVSSNQVKRQKSELPVTSEQHLQARLADVEVQQRQLISNISHELRTPLTLIYGYMQSIFRRGDNLTELQRDALEIAMSEMKKTIQLLQESLDLARVDGSTIRFLIEPVAVNDLVTDTVKTMQKSEQRAIVVEAEALNISVQADAHHLKQVLLKLLDNAVRYSDPDTPIKIKLAQIGDRASISVCDRGCGIPISDQPHIFNPFYRVDRSRNRATGGVGLGLAIVKILVEGMGGSVSVQSQLGEGSIFNVILPIK